MTLVSAIVLLFLVIDPFGNVAFFVAALNAVEPKRRRRVIVRELVIAYLIMVAFLFVGQPFLAVLNISGPALTIAGGVILFLIAIPYVAGPSVLAVELLLMSDQPERWPVWLLAITAAWAATAVVVLFGSQVAERLGRRGLVAIERLMGMILVAISIQMFLTGADMYFARG